MVLMPHPAEDPLQRLTTREADILRLLAEGKTLAAIATARGVTYKTVANSCTVIKEKLGVARTADLIRLAIEMREQR
jgi:two-component system invasion response regulator UvrY